MLIIDPKITDKRIINGDIFFTGENMGRCGNCEAATDADIDNYCWKCGVELRPTRQATPDERHTN